MPDCLIALADAEVAFGDRHEHRRFDQGLALEPMPDALRRPIEGVADCQVRVHVRGPLHGLKSGVRLAKDVVLEKVVDGVRDLPFFDGVLLIQFGDRALFGFLLAIVPLPRAGSLPGRDQTPSRPSRP